MVNSSPLQRARRSSFCGGDECRERRACIFAPLKKAFQNPVVGETETEFEAIALTAEFF